MSVEAYVRQLATAVSQMKGIVAAQQQQLNSLMTRPRTITEEIDQIPGRRLETILAGEATFTTTDRQRRGTPITITVSQDGPFIMTHYAMALWRPSAPSNASNFQRWRPVTTFPLPDQVVDTDIIDIGYELQDGGAQRNFQNAVRGPVLSRPDNIVPCAVPTLWAANSTIQFTPFYHQITFDGGTPPTEGTLHVDLIGYRIVNL